jgi:Zn finger protein HypA/HybF involved in hydrogenase expression
MTAQILKFHYRPRVARCHECQGHFVPASDRDPYCSQCRGWARFLALQMAASRAFDALCGRNR